MKKLAGGIFTREDVLKMLPGLAGSLGTFPSPDIAYGTYVFEYIAGVGKNPVVHRFASRLAEEYASRFADWLGYVFLKRANLTHKSKMIKDIEFGLATWVESIPDILTKVRELTVSHFIPRTSKFLNLDLLDRICQRILREVSQDWKGTKGAKGTDITPWFLKEWLPKNVRRFEKVFNVYGRAEKVPYTFSFSLGGSSPVRVSFERNIKTVEEAISEIRSRYLKGADRGGWLQALQSYDELKKAKGGAAVHAVDKANNLEHTHGAMMEHFPAEVRRWYPRFLDFKYTADILQMVRAIKDEDLRTIAEELLPERDLRRRLVVPKQDHRTPKGLALEISAQPGKSQKRKMLQEVAVRHPEMYQEVVENLKEKGLIL